MQTKTTQQLIREIERYGLRDLFEAIARKTKCRPDQLLGRDPAFMSQRTALWIALYESSKDMTLASVSEMTGYSLPRVSTMIKRAREEA